MKVTLGSLFDGIGGFPLVAERNGILPIWASEIEKYCILITKIRFPNMLHLGDVKELDGGKLEPVGNQYVQSNKCVIDDKKEKVRRLTPLECERLQGFPDNWTQTNHKLCVDSTRFRILGNSLAIPCADFVISRVQKYGFGKNQ